MKIQSILFNKGCSDSLIGKTERRTCGFHRQDRVISSKKDEEAEHIFKQYKEPVDDQPFSFLIHQENKGGKKEGCSFSYMPLISVIVPAYNVRSSYLRDCIDSILIQSYQKFELILVGDKFDREGIASVLREYRNHSHVRVLFRWRKGGIVDALNLGIDKARGEFVAFCAASDLLHPDALKECVSELNHNRTIDFIYTDEDRISQDGTEFCSPYYKPGWSPDSLLCHSYTSDLSMYRTKLVHKAGCFRAEYEGFQYCELALRLSELTESGKICHIPKVLYHGRMIKGQRTKGVLFRDYPADVEKRAKEAALARRGLSAKLEYVEQAGLHRVVYDCLPNTFVSVIIPSKDNYEMLKRCIDSIENYTLFQQYEIIVVDNGSSEQQRHSIEEYLKSCAIRRNQQIRADAGQAVLHMLEEKPLDAVRYIYEPADFNFSNMCNRGVQEARGNYLLFLNDDIEIPKNQKRWMSVLAGHAAQSWTGAVGAKLLYPGMNRIQHDGVIGCHIAPANILWRKKEDSEHYYYYGRNLLEYNYSAVTAACLLVSKKKYHEAGGLCPDFSINYNDVDFCWRLCETGYYNVIRNDVVLCHHESYSRGYNSELLEMKESRALLYRKHPQFREGNDCFYSPHFNINTADFSYPKELTSTIVKILPDQRLFEEKIPQHISFEDYPRCSKWTRYNIEAVEDFQNVCSIKGWVDDPELTDIPLKGQVLLEGDKGRRILIPIQWEARKDLMEEKKLSKDMVGFTLWFYDSVLDLKGESYHISFILEDEQGGHKRILRTRYDIKDSDLVKAEE